MLDLVRSNRRPSRRLEGVEAEELGGRVEELQMSEKPFLTDNRY